MSLKNRYDNVIVRNNQSLGLSPCAFEYLLNLEKENEKLKEVIEKIQKEVDKIFKEYQPFNRAVLLTMLENINNYIKEVSK